MTCPRCYTEFESGAHACPDCGLLLVHNVSGVMKTSAVMIAAGDEHGFYHSVQDVPEPLRTQLMEITNSANAGTIVIADRAGKEQLTQVIARRDSARQRTTPAVEAPSCAWYRGKVWTGVVLLLTACAIIAVVFITR